MTESQNLEQQLMVILSRLDQDRFGGRDAPEVSLVDGVKVDANGALIGTVEIRIRKSDGEMALLHTLSLDGISDERKLKDAFATALSTALSNHANWPR